MEQNYRMIYSQEQITKRVKELGREISEGFDPGRPLIAVCVIKGAVLFYADLVKEITNHDVRFAFISATSYRVEGQVMKSTGLVNIKYSTMSEDEIKDANILIVEDIIDTGRTLHALKGYYYEKGAHQVKIATLLDKPTCRVRDINPDYNAFTLEGNPYVIGYGLDNDQMYRNLSGVCEIIK